MKLCPSCRPNSRRLAVTARSAVNGFMQTTSTLPRHHHLPPKTSGPGQLNIEILYGMVALLALALLFPPWETPPSQAPEFLGLHFLLSPPTPDAIVSRLLLTIELVTIAIAGLYGSFLFRKKL